MPVKGKFSLDKILEDGRRSPEDMVIPTDKNILVFDQHRMEIDVGNGKKRDVTELGKAIGVVKNAWVENGKLRFDWNITDPAIKELARNAPYPEQLFTYSPEHFPREVSPLYPQGRTGVLDAIAVTNLNNDPDAVTDSIYNRVLNWFKNGKEDEGDEMDETKVGQIVDQKISQVTDLFKEKLGILEGIQEQLGKIEKLDVETVNNSMQKMEDITSELNKVQETVKNIIEGDPEDRDTLIKNIAKHSPLEEEDLKTVKFSRLQELNKEYDPEFKGVTNTEKNKGKTEVEMFNDKYGTDVGSGLKKKMENGDTIY